MIYGWLFDLYHDKQGNMIAWLVDERGNAHRLAEKWVPPIYIKPKDASAESLLSRVIKNQFPDAKISPVEKFVKPGDFDRSIVTEIKFKSFREILSFARWISLNCPLDFELFNVGVQPAQAYLYNRDLFPTAFVKVNAANPHLNWELKDDSSRIDYELPPFKVARIKVTVNSPSRLHRITDTIASIEIETTQEKIVYYQGSETDKILQFVNTIGKLDPDIILTDDGDAFIFPLLMSRAEANGISDELLLGRERRPLSRPSDSGKVYFSYGRIFYKPTPARLYGRLHLDTRTDFLFDDCSDQGLLEVARTCRTPLHRASRETIGTNMTSLQMYIATRNDILIPWKKNDPENFKCAKDLLIADRGGLIFEPRVGAFEEVGELDFASLYPALMMKENLTPECLSCHCCQHSPSTVPELGYRICERRVGIIPRTLRILLQKRADYKLAINSTTDAQKRDRYEKRQSALKWILICSFGYLGYKNARFGKIDAHIAVCAHSRRILRSASAMAEAAGFHVVHGIVDSLWLRKPSASDEDFYDLSQMIERGLELPISYEGRYKWIVFLPSRMHFRVPVLNRYYGVLGNGKIKARGIELRRRDTPNLIKQFQRELIQALSSCSSIEELHGSIPNSLQILERFIHDILDHDVPVEDLAFHRQLSKDSQEYLHNSAQTIAAKKLRAQGAPVSAGQLISFIIKDEKARNPENRAEPLELADKVLYDERKYVSLLLDSAVNLLLPLGWTRDRIQNALNPSPTDLLSS